MTTKKVEIRTCARCGREFKPCSNAQKYCSPKCAREVSTDKNIGYIRKRTQLRTKLSKDLIYAYDAKCAVCGWYAPMYLKGYSKILKTRGCDFHHIIPVAEGGTNDSSNVILLCPNCHCLADVGAIKREELMKLALNDSQVEERAKYTRYTLDLMYEGALILRENGQ